jgi:PAS domain S-box-containing protein
MTQKLKNEEKLLDFLKIQALESMSCGIVISDYQQEGNPLIYVNSGFTEITGYTEQESIGQNCKFLQGEDTEQPQLEILRHAIRNGKSCKVILRNYRKDASMFFNELIISPVKNEAGEVTHFIGVQNDVTEREIATQELSKNRSNKIAVKDYEEGSVRLLDPSDLIYIERKQRQVIIHSREKDFPTYFTIEKLEKRLAGFGFYKANQGVLINLNYIEHMVANGDGTYDIILRGKKSADITASRSGSKEILKDLQI